MSEAKHTPGPWEACNDQPDGEQSGFYHHYWHIYKFLEYPDSREPDGTFYDSQGIAFVSDPWQRERIRGEIASLKPSADTEEITANAHLIAAAPDLLEACKALLYHASLGPDERGAQEWEEDCKRMESAIAKAEGRS